MTCQMNDGSTESYGFTFFGSLSLLDSPFCLLSTACHWPVGHNLSLQSPTSSDRVLMSPQFPIYSYACDHGDPSEVWLPSAALLSLSLFSALVFSFLRHHPCVRGPVRCRSVALHRVGAVPVRVVFWRGEEARDEIRAIGSSDRRSEFPVRRETVWIAAGGKAELYAEIKCVRRSGSQKMTRV